MSDSPQTPETSKQRLDKDDEGPHNHDEDDVAPVEEDVPRSHSAKPSPRRKIAYRPLRPSTRIDPTHLLATMTTRRSPCAAIPSSEH